MHQLHRDPQVPGGLNKYRHGRDSWSGESPTADERLVIWEKLIAMQGNAALTAKQRLQWTTVTSNTFASAAVIRKAHFSGLTFLAHAIVRARAAITRINVVHTTTLTSSSQTRKIPTIFWCLIPLAVSVRKRVVTAAPSKSRRNHPHTQFEKWRLAQDAL